MFFILKKHFVTFLVICILLPASSANVTRQDETDLGGKHYRYLYKWYSPNTRPKAVIVLIHGLIMHGAVYDGLAKHLAEEGMIVLAPDLPGYGRNQHVEISYKAARNEITEIIQSAKGNYTGLPIICIGESLGSDLALYALQTKSAGVDGLILSSPALEARLHISPRAVADEANLIIGLINYKATMNMSPYLKNYVSEDSTISKAVMDDPLVRKQLRCRDLWHSYETMWPALKQAGFINSSTPVLLMQGSKDKILKAKAIIKLVSNLNTDDLTVKWFKERGHLLLETPVPQSEVLQSIDDWLKSHINENSSLNSGSS